MDSVFDKLNLTFKYGTKSEIISGLSLYNEKNLKDSNRARYIKILDILLKFKLTDLDINNKILFVIKANKIQQYENYYQTLFDKLMSEDSVVGDNKRLLAITLDTMIGSKNNQFLSNFTKIYKDKDKKMTDKGVRDEQILSVVIRGLREFKKNIDSSEMEELYKNQDSVIIQGEIIKYIGSKKNEGDIQFLSDTLEDEKTPKEIKWITLVALSEYRGNEKAISILKKYSIDKDEGTKSRAVYALSKIGSKKDARSLFEENIRSNSEVIRLQALDIAKEIMDSEIKKILQYKVDSDPSMRVQNKAKKILEESK